MRKQSELGELPRPKPAPIEYAGQWVAWNKEQTEVIAHGRDLASVREAAIAAGHRNAIFERVRQPGVAFIGCT